MKKTFLLSTLVILFFIINAQSPVITSWLQNTTGIVGRHYVSGNSTPITDTAHANIKSVQYSGTSVYVRTQGIPAYITGPFLDGNPSIATAQNAIFKFPLTPVPNTGTLTNTTGGDIGIFINGVAMFDYRDGVSWQNSTSSLKGGPLGGTGDGVWNRDAVVAERVGFDCSKAHPAMGNYHHHQNPSAFNMDLNVLSTVCNLYASDGLYVIDSTVHSPLIGFAYDGYPVYGPYAYKDTDGTGGIVRMKSSYGLRNITTRTTYSNGSTVTAGPAVSGTYPLGYFREDYQYNPTSSATPDYLDAHNGRFCVTPEYPNGTYCYFATVDANWNSAYPYLIGPTFYGVYANAKVTTIPGGTTYYTPGSIITTYSPTTPCAGASINVTFTSTGTFGSGNIYTAQLSDASGSFTSPVNIGTLSSTSSGSLSITATIPVNTATGSGYKIRVLSSNSTLTGSSTVAFTINALPTAIITASGPTTFCQGGNVTLTASSGSSYVWSPGGAITQSINVSASAGYSVVVSNGVCSATSTATVVTVNPTPVASVGITGNTTFCQGGSVTLTASAGSNYLWSPGGFTTQSINATANGSYSVVVTNANNCSAVSSAVVVTVNASAPATITASGATTFCQGGSVDLTASAGLAYVWSPGGAGTQGITVSASGSYTVVVTNANGCSSTSTATVVTVNPLPTASITAGGPTTFCAGGNVTLTSSAGTGYLWSPGGAITQSIAATASGSYSVVVSNGTNCSVASLPIIVTVDPAPSASITANGPTAFCHGGSVTLTASAGTGYLWSPGGATTQSISATSTGNYSVFVSTGSNCSATASATMVTVNANPDAPVSGGDITVCANQVPASLTASSTGNVIDWFADASGGTPIVSANNSYSTSTAGTYYAETRNAGTGCISAARTPVSLIINSSLAVVTPVFTLGATSVRCQGTGSVIYQATAPNSTGLGYSLDANATSAGNSINSATGAVTWNASFSGTATITATATGCGGPLTATHVVTVTPVATPLISISVTPGDHVCDGTGVTFNSTISSGGSSPAYVWKKNNNVVGGNTASYTENAPANTDAISCGLTSNLSCAIQTPVSSNTITMTVYALPTAPVITQTGNTLQSTVASFYQWYLNAGIISSANNQTYVVSQSGSYEVQITDNNGCHATSAATNVVFSGIDETEGASTFLIYPNPATDFIAIQLKTIVRSNVEVELYDITGKFIQRTIVYQGSTIAYFDTRILYNGDYVVRFNDNNKQFNRKVSILK